VLVDLVMPGMSGREVTEQIRQIAPRTRILWCSGYVRSNQAEEADPYLQKPFTSQDLLRAVKHALTEGAEAPTASGSARVVLNSVKNPMARSTPMSLRMSNQ